MSDREKVLAEVEHVWRNVMFAADHAALSPEARGVSRAEMVSLAVKAALVCALDNGLIEVTPMMTWPFSIGVTPSWERDGKCPCDSPMYATGDCPIHDTKAGTLGEPLDPPRIPRELHVTPTSDQIEHTLDDECPCGPRTEFVDGGVVVTHHSLDGRESEDQP